MDTVVYDPSAPDVRDNPYPSYALLRERAPVHHVPKLRAYALGRYEDVARVVKDTALFSSESGGGDSPLMSLFRSSEELSRVLRVPSLVSIDPPRHTRLRALVNRAFTSARVAALEPRIRTIARDLLAALRTREEIDLMADFASPLPVIVIAEMLGVEPERREDFRRWSNTVVSASSLLLEGAALAPIEAAFRELRLYLEAAIDARRKQPRDDLISALIESGEHASVLTPEEVVAFTRLLLVAGNETTTNLLGNALVALLAHPEQMALLRQEPARIPMAVEEALRFDSPAQAVFRVANRDVTIAGTTVQAGSMVLALLASANRDPRRFPDPERFDVTRDARGHLAFGHGIHFCLGAPLARIEARVALEELLAATRSIAYAPGQECRIDWGDSLFLRGPKVLRLQVAPAA